MKVLILSTGTGEGHNSAAKAVKEQFDNHGVPCELADALDFASDKAADYGRRVYIWSTVKARKVFAGAYRAGRAISSSRHKSPVYYANALYAGKLYQYIVENGFDTVVMPHLFPAEAVTYMMKKHHPQVNTYFVATDYTCIPFTEETDVDYYFIPHEDLKEEYIRRGIPEKKLIPTGIPVSARFVNLPDKAECRKRLGIAEDTKCILVMTGSMGYGNVGSLIGRLVAGTDENTDIYVMGGTNEKLKESLRKTYQDKKRVVVLDFTNQAQIYMAAADVLFTKPGGLTSSEAAAACVPLVHTHPIPGCEDRNVAFFTARGMSVSDKKEEEVVRKGLELLNHPDMQEKMRECQKAFGKADAAEKIYEFIVSRQFADKESGDK